VRILFLSRWYPFPPDNGAKIRAYNLLRQLSKAHEVSMISFAAPTDRVELSAEDGPARFCTDLRVIQYRDFQPTSTRALAGLFSARPRYLADVHSEAFAQAVDRHLAANQVDLVIAATLTMMPYALQAPSSTPLMLEELELSMFRDQVGQATTYLGAARRWLMWTKLRGYLRRTLPSFGATTVVSEAERQNVTLAAPKYEDVHVIPNAVPVHEYGAFYGTPEPWSMVFAGSLTYGPNYEAANWLLRSVYPRVKAEVPSALVRISGRHDGVDIRSLPRYPGIELTGHVADIRPLVARSAVSVVPLLSGGGTRLKILESMALGTPVVSTSKGAEGLDVKHNENILIADTPSDFAICVGAVIRDRRLRQRLSDAGRSLVWSRYDWNVVGEQLRTVVEQAAARQAASAPEVRP
jgi:glycosyltransferase involved in cell wall biosynthesis